MLQNGNFLCFSVSFSVFILFLGVNLVRAWKEKLNLHRDKKKFIESSTKAPSKAFFPLISRNLFKEWFSVFYSLSRDGVVHEKVTAATRVWTAFKRETSGKLHRTMRMKGKSHAVSKIRFSSISWNEKPFYPETLKGISFLFSHSWVLRRNPFSKAPVKSCLLVYIESEIKVFRNFRFDFSLPHMKQHFLKMCWILIFVRFKTFTSRSPFDSSEWNHKW